MQKYSIAALTLLLFSSCIFNNEINPKDIQVSFKLYDTTGVERNVFKQEEEFLVEFKVANYSTEILTYQTGLPIVFYTIFMGDSVIARSTDEMDYIEIWYSGKIEAGDTFTDTWLAPNTLGRKQSQNTIALSRGFYQIEVQHKSFFDEYRLPQTKSLDFEVIE